MSIGTCAVSKSTSAELGSARQCSRKVSHVISHVDPQLSTMDRKSCRLADAAVGAATAALRRGVTERAHCCRTVAGKCLIWTQQIALIEI
jgi:hypothetical protein